MFSQESFSHRFIERKPAFFFFIALVVVIVLFSLSIPRQNVSLANPSEWQAIFLNNGQVYFGHLDAVRGEYRLKNVYYLRAAQALQPPAGTPSFDLVKLGGELHGPEDEMHFSKTAVLFWENMRNDSQVTLTINNYQRALQR